MAHAYVNASQSNGQTATTITLNHTPNANATVAVLGICVAGETQRTGTPTLNGMNMTQAGTTRGGALNYETSIEVWYLCFPFTSGQQFTISVPNAGGLTCHLEVCCANAGAGYDSAYYSTDGTGATSGDGLSISFNQSAQGDFKYVRLGCGEAAISSITPAWTGATEVYQNDHGAYTSWSHYLICGASNANPAWTWSNDDGAVVGVCFQSVAQTTLRINQRDTLSKSPDALD